MSSGVRRALCDVLVLQGVVVDILVSARWELTRMRHKLRGAIKLAQANLLARGTVVRLGDTGCHIL